jgi:hypothetical protein
MSGGLSATAGYVGGFKKACPAAQPLPCDYQRSNGSYRLYRTDMLGAASVPSEDICVQLCDAVTACIGFVYDLIQSFCYTFSASVTPGMASDPNLNGGLKLACSGAHYGSSAVSAEGNRKALHWVVYLPRHARPLGKHFKSDGF